jgi:hypothetical protein
VKAAAAPVGDADPDEDQADRRATDTMPVLIPARIVVAGPVSDCLAIFFTGR